MNYIKAFIRAYLVSIVLEVYMKIPIALAFFL